jgi:hypothetical protein
MFSDLLGGGDKGAAPETTAIVPAAKPALPSLGGARGTLIGGIHITPERLGLKPPRLQIVHKKDRRDQKEEPGQMKLGRLTFDEVTAVFVNAHAGRQLPMGEGKETHIACASMDGDEPLSTITPYAEKCASCAYAQWETNSETGKRIPPPCNEFVAMLGVLVEGKLGGKVIPGELRPFWMIGVKTGQVAFKEFLNAAQAEFENGVEHLGQFVATITTEPQEGKGFTWYTPIFTVTRRVSGDEYRKLVREAEEARYAPSVRQDSTDVQAATNGALEIVDDGGIPF